MSNTRRRNWKCSSEFSNTSKTEPEMFIRIFKPLEVGKKKKLAAPRFNPVFDRCRLEIPIKLYMKMLL